jgi:hypothetical protein
VTDKPLTTKSRPRTPITIVQRWLEALAVLCAGSSITADELKREVKLYASELCLNFDQAFFTSESASQIGAQMTFGWPTVGQISSALMKWSKATGVGQEGPKQIISDERMKDPRAALLDLEGKVWLARWDQRVIEIKAETDPRWDSTDAMTKRQSKLANLASMTRTYAPALVWQMIATPFQATREIDAAAFMSEWLRLAPMEPPEKSADPLRNPRGEDALSF